MHSIIVKCTVCININVFLKLKRPGERNLKYKYITGIIIYFFKMKDADFTLHLSRPDLLIVSKVSFHK